MCNDQLAEGWVELGGGAGLGRMCGPPNDFSSNTGVLWPPNCERRHSDKEQNWF